MGLSGFLYVAIVVGWAVYLVPFALKRYDEATRNRSVDKFSSAMRVLGRRDDDTAGMGAEVDPGAARAAGVAATVAESAGESARAAVASRQAQRRAAVVAARRRRRVLLTLLVLTVATATVAVFSLIPWWSVGIPAGLVALWLVTCRTQVRLESDAYWTDVAAAGSSSTAASASAGIDLETGTTHLPDARDGEFSRARRLDAGPAVAEGSPGDDEPTVVLDEAARSQIAVPLETSDGETLWDPVPVTLPTYVSKPRAPRTIRTIELGEAEGLPAPVERDEQAQPGGNSAPVETDAAAPEAEPRRAVGE
ncbi:MAG: divisome protein SepX/GlpR [Nocardioidaceae bacterium]